MNISAASRTVSLHLGVLAKHRDSRNQKGIFRELLVPVQILRRPDGRPRLSASAPGHPTVLLSQCFALPGVGTFGGSEASHALERLLNAMPEHAAMAGPYGNHGLGEGRPQGRFTAAGIALQASYPALGGLFIQAHKAGAQGPRAVSPLALAQLLPAVLRVVSDACADV